MNVTDLDIEWEPIKYNPPITAYVLELDQDNNTFSEVCLQLLSSNNNLNPSNQLDF